MNKTQYSEDFERMMAINFALVDLNLFLDTHPDDEQALKDYNYLVEQFDRAQEMFNENYGPFVNFGHDKSDYPWQWVNTPWPWDM